MLVFSRTKHEAVRIGENIRLVVVEITEKQVRLGFEAPRDVPIDREEVYFSKHKGWQP